MQHFKDRGYGFWLGCLILLVGLPLLVYYGYCWGLWGRQSLVLQYLFQCSCPTGSEDTRYPKQVEVVVPACRYISSRLSPSGQLIYIQEEKSRAGYFLNLQTGEKKIFALPEGANYFLTDNLIFHASNGGNSYILDLTDLATYPIQPVRFLKPGVYSLGHIEPNLLVKALLQVDEIFFIDDVFQPTIALSSDFRIHPEHSFTFNAFDFPTNTTNPVEAFLLANHISYQPLPGVFPQEIPSPDGRFIARDDGIYLMETNQKILEGYSPSGYSRSYSGKYFSVRGWAYDGSGVIYSSPVLGPCVLETAFFIFEEPGCFGVVPQPILELKVPEEYLLPKQRP